MKSKKADRPERAKFGTVILDRRSALGLSQEQLAERVGCHRNYMGRIERGEQNITLDMMIRVAKGLECRISEMTEEAGL